MPQRATLLALGLLAALVACTTPGGPGTAPGSTSTVDSSFEACKRAPTTKCLVDAELLLAQSIGSPQEKVEALVAVAKAAKVHHGNAKAREVLDTAEADAMRVKDNEKAIDGLLAIADLRHAMDGEKAGLATLHKALSRRQPDDFFDRESKIAAAFAKQGDFEMALTAARAAQKDEDRQMATAVVAKAKAMQGDVAGARALLRELSNPQARATVTEGIAIRTAGQGNPALAHAMLAEVDLSVHRPVEGLLAVGHAYLAANQRAAALRVAAEARSKMITTAETQKELSNFAAGAKTAEEKLGSFFGAFAIMVVAMQEGAYVTAIVDLQTKADDFDAAMTTIEGAKGNNLAQLMGFGVLTQSLSKKERRPAAVALIRSIEEFYTRQPDGTGRRDGLLNVANMYLGINDIDSARRIMAPIAQHARQATRGPDVTKVWARLAPMQAKAGERDAALVSLSSAVEQLRGDVAMPASQANVKVVADALADLPG